MKLQLIRGHSAQTVYGDHFDEGPRYSTWRPQGSGDCLLVYTLRGAGQVGNLQEQMRVGPGDVVLFEQHAEQVYFTDPATGRWEFLWSHYLPRQAWNYGANWPQVVQGVRRVVLPGGPARNGVRTALEDMIRWVRQPEALAVQFALNALEKALLWICHAHNAGQGNEIDPRIRAVMESLAREVQRPFDIATTARQAGMSASRFSHLFREQAGRPPREYAEEQKMRHAAQLLRLTNQSVQEVASACGFENPFYFSSRFRKWAQTSPRSFRKKSARA